VKHAHAEEVCLDHHCSDFGVQYRHLVSHFQTIRIERRKACTGAKSAVRGIGAAYCGWFLPFSLWVALSLIYTNRPTATSGQSAFTITRTIRIFKRKEVRGRMYRCTFCRDDAVTVFDVVFGRSRQHRTIGTCQQHRPFVINRLVYLCECGEVSAIGLRHICKAKGEDNGQGLQCTPLEKGKTL